MGLKGKLDVVPNGHAKTGRDQEPAVNVTVLGSPNGAISELAAWDNAAGNGFAAIRVESPRVLGDE